MSDNNKSYRIKANIHEDKLLNVNINNDYNILEVLSLKIGTEDFYKLHTSNYGCVAGRVLANEGFGIPNAKISIFISATTEDLEDDIVSYLYPYRTTSTKNYDNIRYNLLTEEQLSDCHRNVGSFPSKRMVLDDNNVLEVYDKYYKFTTRTNNSGDYIIFGVPVGNQTLHVDIDLSDIGALSQKPRDMVYKGYTVTQFENANMFKKSTDLDNLTQIITQNQELYVYPFWGEESENTIAISRKDIDIQYEFTPTCVFMGSLITDERSNGISKRCIPSERMGKMDRLTTGNGTIEMIRKKIDGSVEEFIIQGNQLIDGNGVWCYQIPMNLDYVRTDEYGNTVPTDDTKKGIPTRTSVRFRISLTEFELENEYSHLSKVLVPNNPKNNSDKKIDYVFGTKTSDDNFRDLFWNNVYTVKSYIPRLQMMSYDRNKKFSGIKAVNVNNSNNPIPYNNMRINLTFMFGLQCAIFKILLWIVGGINWLFSKIADIGSNIGKKFIDNGGRCVYIGDGYCQNMEGWYFAPKCTRKELLDHTFEYLTNEHGEAGEQQEPDTSSIDYQNKNLDEKICLTNNITYFVQCVELTFAMEYEVIQFDFYNDWINGLIYMPRWFADVRKKRSFLFGLITINPKINACMENGKYWFERRYVQQCALSYNIEDNHVTTPRGCGSEERQSCHNSAGRKFKNIFKNGGIVHDEKVSTGEYAYYFKPCEWVNNGLMETKCNLFATDLVLLGSLDENNAQGIPQTFKKLVSSSYQMPDPLASTNLGEEGYVYTGEKDEGTLCGNNKTYGNSAINRQTPTFENVSNWSTYQLNKEDMELYKQGKLYDEKEYAVTEASGIDWGYIGPNQKTDDANMISKGLYFPGGHFLGISCVNSQSNIKSCINLSRICEMGTLMSQRQSIVRRVEKTNEYGKKEIVYTYSYLVPTGLISGDEINDYGVKNEFATLNYNNLNTRLNKDTNLLEYVFETINPINFNGELKEEIKKDKNNYNNTYGFNDDETKKDEEPLNDDYSSWAYRRTIEENSNDYYKFRLNIHKDDDKKSKYLIVNGNEVALPMYENSFYFYFGLKNGNTALDNFYKNFFAECPKLKEYEPSISITTKDRDYCTDNGEITVHISGIDVPNIRIVNLKTKEEESHLITNDTETYTGFTDGEYDIYVNGDNLDETYNKKVKISVNKPKSFSELSYTKTDYSDEVGILIVTGENGKIKFNSHVFLTDENVRSIIITTDINDDDRKKYAAVIYNSESTDIGGDYNILYSSVTTDESTTEEITLWGGNRTYEILFCYNCSGKIKTEVVSSVYVKMPKGLDIYFNKNSYASYRNIVLPMLSVCETIEEKKIVLSEWHDIFLTTENRSDFYAKCYNKVKEVFGGNIPDEVKFNIEKSLFYTNPRSILANSSGKIVYSIFSQYPYTTDLSKGGGGERLSNAVLYINNDSTAEDEGYSVSMADFISPTQDAPNSIYYLYDYTVNGNKNNYGIIVKSEGKILPNIGNNNVPLTMPSIYRPFFFRSLFISECAGKKYFSTRNFNIAIANGIGNKVTVNSSKFSKFVIANSDSDYGSKIPETSPYKFETYYKTYVSKVNGFYTDNTLYDIQISDEKGNNTKSKSIDMTFIGDGDLYKVFNENVEYYYFPDEDISKIEKYKKWLLNATVYNKNNKIQYNESYWEDKAESNGTIWNDALSIYLQSHCEYISGDKIWSKHVGFLSDNALVIGIYDSNLIYNDYVPSYNDGIIQTSGNIEPRHENSISIIRLYTGKVFKTLVINDA